TDMQILRTEDLAHVAPGRRVSTAGLVLVRQRPGSANGVIFLTMEDETGVANTIIWPKVFESLRPIVLGARFIAVTGKLQSEAGVIHIIVERAEDLTPLLGLLTREGGETGKEISALARADAVKRPHQAPRFPLAAQKARKFARENATEPELFNRDSDAPTDLVRVLPKGRNFH
ncbi:MAG TPA: OB-fold nucleic acid binding domain-containing protein, partial [Methylovirgula sp.]